MFVDAVLGNLLVFVVGQAFAWLYLRTGRFWLGIAATTSLWVAVDWWLVGRFLLEAGAASQMWPLLLLQGTATWTAAAYLWATLRRRRSAGSRRERFARGQQQILAGRWEPAQETFAQLCWNDPWDAAAWIARGDVLRARAEPRRARRCYARARAVDVRRRFADLLRHREGLLGAGRSSREQLPGSAAKAGPRPAVASPRVVSSAPGGGAVGSAE